MQVKEILRVKGNRDALAVGEIMEHDPVSATPDQELARLKAG